MKRNDRECATGSNTIIIRRKNYKKSGKTRSVRENESKLCIDQSAGTAGIKSGEG